MARKKSTYVPDFMGVSMSVSGQLMMNMRVKAPVSTTARSFRGLITLHNDANKTSVAITLIEIARALLPEDTWESDKLNDIIAHLIVSDLPMQITDLPDDWPF